jgi:hypothetical protein
LAPIVALIHKSKGKRKENKEKLKIEKTSNPKYLT